MRFSFSAEQLLFRDTVRAALEKECPPEAVRAAFVDGARSRDRWGKLAELGVAGLMVPERWGGLGLHELDLVLALEESGRAALPEPIVETAAVAVPLLAELGPDQLNERWLTSIVSGASLVALELRAGAAIVSDAAEADLLLLVHGDELHALDRRDVTLTPRSSVDGARRPCRVEWTPTARTRMAGGEPVRRALAAGFDRGALGVAAQLCGLGRRMIDLTVEYVKVRQQFGQPVGSFQAVKHQLANALLAIEFARPVVYRAAYSMTHALPERSTHVSMAKAYASDAARGAARAALQCHGAIGYSYEHALHFYMKRAWALSAAWGDAAFHRARVGSAIFDAQRSG